MDTEVRVHTTFNCMLRNKKKKKKKVEWPRGMRLWAEKIAKRNLCDIKLASGSK